MGVILLLSDLQALPGALHSLIKPILPAIIAGKHYKQISNAV